VGGEAVCPFLFHFNSKHTAKINLHTATMKHTAKFFRAYDDTWAYYHTLDTTRKQCQQTLEAGGTEELCSIPCNLNNFTSSENAQTQHTIGRFQQDTQEALKNSRIDEACKIVEAYTRENNNKYHRFLDIEKDKIVIFKQLNRFDEEYVYRTKKKLSELKKIGAGKSIMHITLTIRHSENSDYIQNYHVLKNSFTDFIQHFKRLIKKDIDYISTYEVTEAKDGKYHQHIHLIIIGMSYLRRSIVANLKQYWQKKTGSKYLFFKFTSKNSNIRIFDYVLKYIQKEIANINLTSILLFSLKGKAYTMSLSLKKMIAQGEKIIIRDKKYKFLNSFVADEIFSGYCQDDYVPSSLTFFFSVISEEEKRKIYAKYNLEASQENETREKEKYWEEKNNIFKSIIKIK